MNGGGAERVASLLVNHWAANAHSVSLLLAVSPGSPVAYPVDDRVEIAHLGILNPSAPHLPPLREVCRPSNFTRFAKLRRAILQRRPAIVVSFMDRINVATLIACAATRLPVVVSERVAIQDLGAIWNSARRITYPLARRIVVQTPRAATLLPRSFQPRIAVIPNPVPQPAGEGQVAADLPSTFVFSAGRLVDQKNHALLIRAFADACAADPASPWHLVIAGDGPLRNPLRDLAKSLGIAERTYFIPWMPSIGALYRRAAIYALSSHAEGFPNALVEAMSCGVPVIATDCPFGPAEILGSSGAGLLSPPGDVGAFAQNLQTLMRDPSLRSTMGKIARDAASRYAASAILPLWDELLPRQPFQM